MAYDKEELYHKALSIIDEKKVYNIEDVISYMPCSKSTFYELFPGGSDELDAIKEKCDNLKIDIKANIRAKLINSEKAAELIALYKLVANDDERRALSMQQVEHSGSVETKIIGFNFVEENSEHKDNIDTKDSTQGITE